MSVELPRFLTKELALHTMEEVAHFVAATFPIKRMTFHVVMLDADEYPDRPITPHLLAEYSHDGQGVWNRDYNNIARRKALQLWRNRNDGDTDSATRLLLDGDTPYWGGVKRDGIVVTCSGVQPWYDQMISGMVADICIARAHDAKVTWLAAHPDAGFT